MEHFGLGNRDFQFQRKYDFPSKVTEEFLLVDLVNNLDALAEDREEILKKILVMASQLPAQKFKQTIMKYGSVKTKIYLKDYWIKNKYIIS